MAESSNGQTRPADDSSCYNCGARGHWIVACPEPIRQTPAGLANAWRNAPHAGNAGQGNNRHHGNQKRPNRGPIITKYAPPPPPPPPPHPPQSALGHGTASYTPLAGPSYQPPGPQFQNPYPHYQPAPHYPAAYGPPQYPAAQYAQPPYGTAPAAPVGYAPHSQGPSAPGPAPGAAPASYPPAYASYPPPVPSSTPGYPPQAAYAQPYPQQPYGPAPVPYPVHTGPAHYHPPPKPPHAAQSHHSQPTLNQAVHHSLPPKPPRSIHTQQDTPRDNRNKRKHDRHGKPRDRRRDQGSRHRSSNQKTQNKANRSNRSHRSNPSSTAVGTSQKAPAPVNEESSKGDTLLPTTDLGHNAQPESESSKSVIQEDLHQSSTAQERQHQDGQSNDGGPDDESHTADESSHSLGSDEPEKPSPGDEALSTRDHEQPSHQPQDHGKDAASTPGSITPDISQLNGKHKRQDDESEDERHLKRTKSSASFTDGLGAAVGNRTEVQSATELEARDDEEPTVQGDDVTLPPLGGPSRSRSKERHQRPKSRNSSVSSRSSDLNSLEAELLGRPARQRSPVDNGIHHRQDRFALPKAQRRRQRNVDSAYSRRW
ncbi:hypothetical protein J3F83DRAFT_759911 [Trichoderma novae-zelandiae]